MLTNTDKNSIVDEIVERVKNIPFAYLPVAAFIVNVIILKIIG